MAEEHIKHKMMAYDRKGISPEEILSYRQNPQGGAEREDREEKACSLTEKLEQIQQGLGRQKKKLELLAHRQARYEDTEGKGIKIPSSTSRKSLLWEQYMRKGIMLPDSRLSDSGVPDSGVPDSGLPASGLESKALSEATEAEGGYFAPSETEKHIDLALSRVSPIRRIASVQKVRSSLLRKPVRNKGAKTGWAGANEIRQETLTPELTLLEFPVADLYALPAATQTLLDDGYLRVDEWLVGEIQDVFAQQETKAFTLGDGQQKPRGFLRYPVKPEKKRQWGEVGSIVTGARGDFHAAAPIDALIDLIYALKPVYRSQARFVMNRRTISKLRHFKDTNGNYIWQPAVSSGESSSLLGYPVTEIEDMPDIAENAYAIAFGDFQKSYLIVDRQGLQVLRDPYSKKPYVLFYVTKRVGGGIQDFDGLKLLKFAER